MLKVETQGLSTFVGGFDTFITHGAAIMVEASLGGIYFRQVTEGANGSTDFNQIGVVIVDSRVVARVWWW